MEVATDSRRIPVIKIVQHLVLDAETSLRAAFSNETKPKPALPTAPPRMAHRLVVSGASFVLVVKTNWFALVLA
jgi:hypothetical protein